MIVLDLAPQAASAVTLAQDTSLSINHVDHHVRQDIIPQVPHILRTSAINATRRLHQILMGRVSHVMEEPPTIASHAEPFNTWTRQPENV